MPFQPVPDTAQFRMQFTLNTEQCENVFHCKSEDAWDSTKLNLVAGTFGNWWISEMRGLAHTGLTLRRVIGTDISVEGGDSVEWNEGLPVAGTGGSGAGLPNNCTLAVKWGTGHAGRGFRGRTFHMGLSSGQLSAPNTVDSTVLNNIREGYDALRTALDNVVLNCEFSVVSRYYNGAIRMPALATPITGVSIENILDSQRRRLPGRGV